MFSKHQIYRLKRNGEWIIRDKNQAQNNGCSDEGVNWRWLREALVNMTETDKNEVITTIIQPPAQQPPTKES